MPGRRQRGRRQETLAREVAHRLDLPLIHLDRHFWQPGWVPTDEARWRATVAGLAARPAWVMDGNYGGSLDLRLPRADLLVFCDLPLARRPARAGPMIPVRFG
ncbi:hypothetical protein [Micromonospora deserti]|uniref:hypothetical protein n=1 Tax=Micromonospora deserti TaxID=2070366 RepID=UPI0018F30AA0|nr:hypothetical protein [Micromonospora deserti]